MFSFFIQFFKTNFAFIAFNRRRNRDSDMGSLELEMFMLTDELRQPLKNYFEKDEDESSLSKMIWDFQCQVLND